MEQQRRRRAPRYGRFIGTGAVAGVLVAVVLAASRPASPDYDRVDAAVYLGLVLALVGGLIGGSVALVLDARARRRR